MEKYFVGTLSKNPEIEAVEWFEQLKDARKEAKIRKQRFPEEAEDVIIAKLLFPKKEA